MKLRIFIAGVASVALYGCECWCLDEGTEKLVRAWGARRLAVLTGRSIRDEYVDPVWSLLGAVRKRRLQWLGKVLRREEVTLVRRFILAEAMEGSSRRVGGILDDVPEFDSVEGLIEMAMDEEVWDNMVTNMVTNI